MSKECAICGNTQCLNLVEETNIKDNICCICLGLSYESACDMCQLRLPEKHKHSSAIYFGSILVLLLIAISIIFIINFPVGPFYTCNNFSIYCK